MVKYVQQLDKRSDGGDLECQCSVRSDRRLGDSGGEMKRPQRTGTGGLGRSWNQNKHAIPTE